MARAVYVDTSRTASRTADGKRKKRKPHYVFDGEKIFEVNKLTKLKDVDEVYIDTLFPEIYEEVLELLKRGIKVYLLKDTSILKKLRRENNLEKSDEIDALTLSKVPREYFRELTVEEMELKITVRPLINRYEWIAEKRKKLKQWKSMGFDYNFGEPIEAMERDRMKIGREIVKTLTRSIYKDVYRRVCNELQIKDSVEVAILVLELPLTSGINKLKSYLGFTPTRNDKHYNRRLRHHLASLAFRIYPKNHSRGANIPRDFIEIIKNTQSKSKALRKLQLKILKILRRVWIEVNSQPSTNLLADEQ